MKKSSKKNYYADQLDRIQLHSEYPATIVVTQGVGSVKTNHLNLNDESASELVTWLTANFNINMPSAPVVHVFYIKYAGPTEGRNGRTIGSRIKITSERFEQSITLSYDYQIGNTLRQAEEYLREKGYAIVGNGETKGGYYIISSTFKPLKGE